MKFISVIAFRFVCLLLMVHLLAINMRADYYMSFIHCTNISKDFDIEEESMPTSKSSETSNSDICIDDFLSSLHHANKITSFADFTESANKLTFHFSINAFPKVHYEIQSPPPRA